MRLRVLAALISAGLLAGALLLATLPAASAITFNPCILSPDQCATLTIHLTGNGYGFVETTKTLGGSPDGFIQCSEGAGYVTGTCVHEYFVGTGVSKVIYLVRTPQSGSMWCNITGSCFTTSNAFTVTLTAGASATSGTQFKLVNPATLTVAFSGSGTGKITSSPAGIDCPTKCTSDFTVATYVTLTVTPAAGSTFRGWSIGPCHGQDQTCNLSMYDSYTVTADLLGPAPTPSPTPKPTTTPKPTATPKVTAAPSTAASSAPTTPATAGPSAAGDGSPIPGASSLAEPTASAASTVPTAAAPAATPSATGTTSPAGSTGGTDLTPVVLAIILVGVLLAIAVFLGLRRRQAA